MQINGGGSDTLSRGLPDFHRCLCLANGTENIQILFGLNSNHLIMPLADIVPEHSPSLPLRSTKLGIATFNVRGLQSTLNKQSSSRYESLLYRHLGITRNENNDATCPKTTWKLRITLFPRINSSSRDCLCCLSEVGPSFKKILLSFRSCSRIPTTNI